MKDEGPIEEQNGGCVDISSQGQPQYATNGKVNMIANIHTPLDSADAIGERESLLGTIQDRLEDARDALLDNETGARVVEMAGRVVGAGTAAWSFSKKAAWVIGTSALVLVVPLLYEMDKEMSAATSAEGITASAQEPAAGPSQVETGDSTSTPVGSSVS